MVRDRRSAGCRVEVKNLVNVGNYQGAIVVQLIEA